MPRPSAPVPRKPARARIDHWREALTDPALRQLAHNWLLAAKPACLVADEQLARWTFDHPDRCLAAICAIAQQSPSSIDLAKLGVEVLEGFLSLHGERYFVQVQELSRRHSRFRQALGSVWQGGMEPALWERVRALTVGSPR